jgi:hypothetical protein
VVGEFRKRAAPRDNAIGGYDADDSFAKVASVRAGNLHLQDDVRAGVDFRSGRATHRHSDRMRSRLMLDGIAHAIVRL